MPSVFLFPLSFLLQTPFHLSFCSFLPLSPYHLVWSNFGMSHPNPPNINPAIIIIHQLSIAGIEHLGALVGYYRFVWHTLMLRMAKTNAKSLKQRAGVLSWSPRVCVCIYYIFRCQIMVADTSVVCDVLHGIQQQVGRTGRNAQFRGLRGWQGKGIKFISSDRKEVILR